MRYKPIIVGLLAATSKAQICPEGWTGAAGSCYMLTSETADDWLVAQDYCAQLRPEAQLASFTNSAEASAVITGNCAGQASQSFWTGLNDLDHEASTSKMCCWSFSNGASTSWLLGPEGQQFWAQGQPNNRLQSEDCVAVIGGRLDDRACTNQYPGCCAYIPSPSPSPSITPSITKSPSTSPSTTQTLSSSPTTSGTASYTATVSSSPTVTKTSSPSESLSPSRTPSRSRTATYTRTVSLTPSRTRTTSPSSSATASKSSSGTPSGSYTISITASPSPSATQSLTSSISLSSLPTPSSTSTTTPSSTPSTTTSMLSMSPTLTVTPSPRSLTPSPTSSRTQYYSAPIYYCDADTGITIRNQAQIRTNAIGINYVDYMDCQLLIVSPADQIIYLSFSQFQTESCCDFFEAFDGRTTAAPRLLRQSGANLPATIMSSGPYMLVKWTTDYSIVGSGVVANIAFAFYPSPTPTMTPSTTPSLSVTNTISRTPTTSVTSSITSSNSGTPSITPSPSTAYYVVADASTDFRSYQGNNGWSYGYYLSTAARQTFKSNEYSNGIFIYGGSWCRLANNYMHPNYGAACSTTGYGYCRPSLLWTNPSTQSSQPYRITYSVSHAHACGDGVLVQLRINGILQSSDSDPTGTLSINRAIDYDGVQTIELTHDPRGGCDCDQITYSLQVKAIVASLTPTPSITSSMTKTSSITASRTSSTSSTISISLSSSPSSSITKSASQSPSNTVSETPEPSFIPAEDEEPTDVGSDDIYWIEVSDEPSPLVTGSVSPSSSSSSSPTNSITVTNSPSKSMSPSYSTSPSITLSNSITRSLTTTPSTSSSPSNSNSITTSPSNSITNSPTMTPSSSNSNSVTASPSVSITSSPSVTQTPSNSNSVTASPSNSITNSPTISSSPSNSNSVTTSPSNSITNSPTISSSPSNSNSPTTSPSNSITSSPTISSSPSNSNSVTASPSNSITSSPTMTPSPSNSNSPTASPSNSITSSPTMTPSPSNSNSPTTSPSNSITSSPTMTPSPSNSNSVTASPSNSITSSPTMTPSPSNSNSPTTSPSNSITSSPTTTPSPSNSNSITTSPSNSITNSPTMTPSPSNSNSITTSPSVSITNSPTTSPSTSITPKPLQAILEEINQIPLTNFTNNVITSILETFTLPTTETNAITERIQPPYELIAAGFFATNPDAEPITISTGSITMTIAKLNTSATTTFGSAIIPPLPVPADAIVYVSNAILTTTELTTFNLSSNSTSIGVVSPQGGEYSVSNLEVPITVGFGGTTANTSTQECSYWNITTSQWASDGCTLIVDAQGQASCQCTHLTEFALRFRAIAAINAGIIQSLDKLLTLEGLKAAAPIIGLLSAIGSLLLFLIWLLTRLDTLATLKFAALLDSSPALLALKETVGLPPNKSWDAMRTTVSMPLSSKKHSHSYPKSLRHLIVLWLKRIPYFHPWLSIIFRFEPGMPRIFRAIFIIASFITTISISILYYGYKHADTDAALEFSETIVLTLMTTVTSIPLSKIMMALMKAAGHYEFRARYGYLATEIMKRTQLLNIVKILPPEDLSIALKEYEKQLNKDLERLADDWISTGAAAASTAGALDENFEEIAGLNIITDFFGLICSRNKEKLRAAFNKRMQTYKRIYQNNHLIVSRFSTLILRSWHRLPFHTHTSAFALAAMAAWVAWCYTYILGFTALKSAATTFTIIETVAYSLITSHIITQPLLQLVFLLIEWCKNHRRAPDENTFMFLQELHNKVYIDFVAECSLCASPSLICPNNLLLRKVVAPTQMSQQAQQLEDEIQYIYTMMN